MKNFYQNKTILITGAASGIGRSLAERISGFDQTKLILWDRSRKQLAELKQQIGDRGAVHTVHVDLTDSGHVFLEADHFIKQSLLPDIIINCAGVVVGKMFHEHNFDEIRATIDINTTGSMLVVNAFLNEMMKRKSGHIVNLGSASGYIGNPRMSVYAASKWAILGWTESLRLEMNRLKTGIRVTAVIPSYIKTGMFEGVKAPFLVPLLETDRITDLILKGVAKGKNEIRAPFMVRFVPLIKAVLPARAFDWIAGNLLGVYRSMDSFEGRKKTSES